jgi:hypothetical protein
VSSALRILATPTVVRAASHEFTSGRGRAKKSQWLSRDHASAHHRTVATSVEDDDDDDDADDVDRKKGGRFGREAPPAPMSRAARCGVARSTIAVRNPPMTLAARACKWPAAQEEMKQRSSAQRIIR